MEEQLISFETAKLAEEKGFKTKTVTTKVTNDYLLGGKNVMITKMCIYLWLCELQKWLREVHNIDITVYPKYKDLGEFYGGAIYTTRNNPVKSYGSNFKTYEEALEKGLQEALKLI